MKRMGKDVKITLIQTPARVAYLKTSHGHDAFTFDRPSPSPLDDPEKGGAKTDVGYAASLLGPVGEGLIPAHGQQFLLKFQSKRAWEVLAAVLLPHKVYQMRV